MTNNELKKKNNRIVKRLLILTLAMFGFGFALVPLYDVFCDATGLNGRTDGKATTEIKDVDEQRTVNVQLIANTDKAMPWEFGPSVNAIKVHPGERHKVTFLAKNTTANTLTGQAIPSVSPGVAAVYLKKMECFCFNEQVLAGGESKDMPLTFYIDPEIPDDIKTITLSYMLYNKKEKAKESAVSLSAL